MALIEVDVIGPLPVVDARKDADPKEVVASGDPDKPSTVVLDDTKTNIAVFLDSHWANPRPYQPKKTTKGGAPGKDEG